MPQMRAVQCILQGICLCVSYESSKEDACLGPVASYQQFATATSYDVAIQPHLHETTVPISLPDGCRPTLFYVFQRHTIRYPKAKDIEAGVNLLPEIQADIRRKSKKAKLCEQDLKAILEWNNTFPLDKENSVTDSGRDVVRSQVRRLEQRFPTVFKNRRGLNNVIVDFSSEGDRTRETAALFLKSWFGDEEFERLISPNLAAVNPLNTFHQTCEAIMENHGVEVKSVNKERLMKSELFKKYKESFDRKLGINTRKRQLKAMLTQCRFGMVVEGKSPWCALFGPEELKFAEMLSDAEDFDEDAAGTHRNTMMACPVAIDLLGHIRSLNSTDLRLPRVVLHFSHAGAFKKLWPLFGLPTSPQTISRNCTERAWHSSRQSPFNANLNVVHYTCPVEYGNRVAVLFNEKLTHIPGCKESICTISEMENILQGKQDNCNLNDICSH